MSYLFQILFYQPLFNLVVFLYNIIPGNDFGLAIIVTTILIKLFLYPLSQKAIQSQKTLQDLQPKINAIKEKYKNDKEAMSRALLEVYKEQKVNPFSSCLPMVLQFPFFIAIFRIFKNGLNAQAMSLLYPFIHQPAQINNTLLGLVDLSHPNVVLAVLAGLAQFWQTKMMMTKRAEIKAPASKDEDFSAILNKQMTFVAPAITVFIGLKFPAGLALYWLTTTFLTGLQQVWIFKKKKAVKQG